MNPSNLLQLIIILIILDSSMSSPYQCAYTNYTCGYKYLYITLPKCYTCSLEKLSQDSGKDLEFNSKVEQVVIDTSLDELPLNIFDKFPNAEQFLFQSINVQKLSSKYFRHGKGLKMVIGSNNDMKSLEAFAFEECPSLETIELVSSHISIIDRNAFQNLTKIAEIIIYDNDLSFLQDGIFESLKFLKKLDLSRNKFENFKEKSFQGLVGLEKLHLQKNELKEIGVEFRELKELNTLKLQHNDIGKIHSQAFNALTNLKWLDLSNNSIISLNKDLFKNLFNLETLNLDENQIQSVPNGIFSDLAKLTSLFMKDNKIKFLTPNMFKGLTDINYLLLNRNPIEKIKIKSFSQFKKLRYVNLVDSFCINEIWSGENIRKPDNSLIYEPINNTEYDLSLSNCIGCLVPKIKNGKLRNVFLDEDLEIGRIFKATAQVECNEGFFFLIDTPEENEVSCVAEDWNKKFPDCLKLCDGSQIIDYTTDTKCMFQGKSVPCDRSQAPGTKVEIRCNVGYKRKENTTGSTSLICSDKGLWNKEPIKCTPVCGRLSSRSTAFVLGGKDTKISDFPWVAGIYQLIDGKFEQICGGTILTKKIVISAFHCFYNNTAKSANSPSLYKIGVGKYYRSLEAKEESSQIFDIAELQANNDYTGYAGFYISDFAIIILNGSISFGPHILPICIDLSITYGLETIIRAGEIGVVGGWGFVEATGKPSKTLKTITMPVIDFQQCLKSADLLFRPFVTPDKFCMGFTNGSGVCQGDSGSGAYFLLNNGNRDNVYYIKGIVSNTRQARTGGCDKWYTLFTNVLRFIPNIKQAIENYP